MHTTLGKLIGATAAIWVALGIFIFSTSLASANVNWLTAQQQPDGSYAFVGDIATPIQSTTETLRTLELEGVSLDTVSQQFVLSNPFNSVENLFGKISITRQNGGSPASLLVQLLAHQNADGGFGLIGGYESTPLDTSLALQAFVAAQQQGHPSVEKAIRYLLDRQLVDGGWSDAGQLSDVYVTANALLSLIPFEARFNLVVTFANARAFLLSRAMANGQIGDTFETALALMAIAPITFDRNVYQPSLTYLQNVRSPDGSWAGDVYTTALGLRALSVVANATPQDPSRGRVKGTITDAVTALPLAGVTINVVGTETLTAVTDSSGSYRIDNVSPSTVTLNASLSGYLSAAATTTIAAGQTVNFSSGLSRDPTPQLLTISGQIVDSANAQAIVGASVVATSTGANTVSDANGRFILAGLPAGSHTIVISQSGFTSATLAVTAPAGGTLDAGTVTLISGTPTGDTGFVQGVVTDSVTKLPLRGALITVSGADNRTVFSGADGRFVINSVATGDVTISVTLDGYRRTSAIATVVSGQSLVFNAALVPSDKPAQMTVVGRVADSENGTPLSGVTVNVIGTLFTTTSSSNGAFQLNGLPNTALTLGLANAGYHSSQYSLRSPSAGVVDLGVLAMAPVVATEGNQPPIISSVAPVHAATGIRYVYNVQAIDPEGKALTYSLESYPYGMTIDALSGRIEWLPTLAHSDSVNYVVAVADTAGIVARQAVTVSISIQGLSFVVTDVETLNGLTVDETIPTNFVTGNYVSGGIDVQLEGGECSLSYQQIGGSSDAEAITNLDRRAIWLSTSNDLIMDFTDPQSTVSVIPLIDHAPLPHEGIEYTVWGSDDPNAPFPQGWRLATLVSVFGKGFQADPNCNQLETDDYAGLYTFGIERYRYVRVRANYSISIFNDREHTTWESNGDDSGQIGWQSYEAELDGVVAMQCEVPPVAEAGPDIVGLTGNTIQFDGSASQGNILTYGWDLDGDRVIDLTGATPQWTFASRFDREVSLFVVDSRGCVGVDRVRVVVDANLPRPDLVVNFVNDEKIATDAQSMQVSGTAIVTIANQGDATLRESVSIVVFEDTNNTERYEAGIDNLVGEILTASGLDRGGNVTLSVPVQGTLHLRDNRLFAMVDPANNIAEGNEANNANYAIGSCARGNYSCIMVNDDFSNGLDKWTKISNQVGAVGSWAVADGVLETHSGGGVMTGNEQWQDYVAQVDIKFPSGAYNDAAIMFRYQDESNWYQFRVQGGLARIVSNVNGSLNAYVTSGPISVTANVWYTMKVIVEGNRVRTYFDNTLVFDYTGLLLDHGTAGMMTDGVLTHYDNFLMADCGVNFNEFEIIESLNFSQWHAFEIPGTGGSTLPWSIESSGYSVSHNDSSNASVFIHPDSWSDYQIRGSLRINDNSNGAHVGVVVGYEDPQHFYLIRWTNGGGNVNPGMEFLRVNANSQPDQPFAESELLYRNSIAWQPYRDYTYEVGVIPGAMTVTVKDGQQILDSIMHSDPAIVPGRFGFFNNAQPNAVYTAARVSVPNASAADLSVGQLSVTTTSAGRVELTARVGNAGGGDSPDALVSFYQDSPDGQPLATVSLLALAAGEYLDVSVTVDSITAGSIYAVVDAANVVAECNETNNVHHIPVLPQTIDATIAVTTDAQSYGSAAPVNLNATIANPSGTPGEFSVSLTIEDLQGSPIETFGPLLTGVIDGHGSTILNQNWTTGQLLSGTYRLRGRVFGLDGRVLDEAVADFSIAHTTNPNEPLATLRISMDQAVYNLDSSAILEHLAQNITTNASLPATQLRFAVTDPTGQLYASGQLNLGELSAGGQQLRTSNITHANAPTGTYTVVSELVNPTNNTVYAVAQTSYSVIADLRLALVGSVDITNSQLQRGQTQVCTDTVENRSSVDALGVTVRQVVARVDVVTEIQQSTLSVDIAAKNVVSLVRSVYTGGLDEGRYACILQAAVNNEWQTLAHRTFKVIVPPIDIATTIDLGSRGRLLVLLDEKKTHSDDDDEHGPRNSPTSDAQREFLKTLLDSDGWSYTIVTRADDFAREMRSNGYRVYALLSEHAKLSQTVMDELREAVFRGHGLLVAGDHDERNHALRQPLGVKVEGKYSHTTGITVAGATEPTIDWAIDDKPFRIELETALARYHFAFDQTEHRSEKHSPRIAPAVTSNNYGRGHSVFLAFDVLMQAAGDGQLNGAYSEILLDSLDEVHTLESTWGVNAVAPIAIHLENLGIATPVELRITPSAGAKLIDSTPEVIDNTNLWLYSFAMAEGDVKDLTLWVQLPNLPGELATFEVAVNVGIAPDLAEFEVLDFSVAIDAESTLQDALTLAKAFSTASSTRAEGKKILRLLDEAQAHIDKQDYKSALKKLIESTDRLLGTATADATELRLVIGGVIRYVERSLASITRDADHSEDHDSDDD